MMDVKAIASLIQSGKSDQEIASALGITLPALRRQIKKDPQLSEAQVRRDYPEQFFEKDAAQAIQGWVLQYLKNKGVKVTTTTVDADTGEKVVVVQGEAPPAHLLARFLPELPQQNEEEYTVNLNVYPTATSGQ
jgi:cell division septal protein FtsQ